MSSHQSASYAKELLRNAGTEPSPSTATQRLLEHCIRATSGTCGTIYRLRLSTASYVPTARAGSHDPVPELSDPIGPLPGRLSVLQEVIRDRETRIHVAHTVLPHSKTAPSQASSQLLVPIVRNSTCLGLIVIEAPGPHAFSQDHIDFVETAAGVALLLFQMEDALDMLLISQQPLDFSQPMDKFLPDVIQLIAAASGMPLIALREKPDDENILRCTESCGFDCDKADLDLAPIEDYPTFKKALESGEAQVELDMSAPHLANLRGRQVLEKVKTFVVCPVKVGNGTYGTLSFAAGTARYPYSRLDLAEFESIANGIGVAIENYRNFHAARDQDFQMAQVGAAITAVEVAQAARHTARAQLEAVQTLLADMTVKAKKAPRDITEISRHIDEIGEIVKDIEQTLNRIRDVTKPPIKEQKLVSLRQTWDDAINLMRGRLNSLAIKVSVGGPDVLIEAFPDFLRHAWLNLILNSIDAFRERRQKAARVIKVDIDPLSDSSSDVRIRYIDNATGIDPTRLKPKSADQIRPVTDIFELGVTSKAEGSGYGLVLVRKILTDHKGSIDLIDHRNGVVFDIALKKRLTTKPATTNN